MKKTILFTIAAMVAFAASAQINKGVKLVGGSIGFQSQKEKIESGGTSNGHGHHNYLSGYAQGGYFCNR
ncbi:MAG: hypothetical protein KatS3mg032_0172 [Cyclobacteriaceae bacterium]|nr:MAG: hypothetical protein KatS3mg032_0172 [Cyclobacteriaceae bacterium]